VVIITTFEGNQKAFHHYWLPLIYKHQECEFRISGKFVYPKDLKNLKVNSVDENGGPILKCPIDKVPMYRGMIELQKKNKNWIGTPEDLGDWFYDVG